MLATLVQFAPVWEDRAASRARLEVLLGTSPAPAEPGWIVLPEMALSGFTPSVAAATWDSGDYDFFSALARARNSWITVGAARGGRNVALLFDPEGEVVSTYAKRHLFSHSGEQLHYEAGQERATYRIGDLRVGQAICYDLRFPYQFWPDAAEVDVFCVIAAWPARRSEHWKTLLRARAIENQAWVVGVNRRGMEPVDGGASLEYSGDSCVIDPQGRLVLDCGSAEGAFSCDLDPGAASSWRLSFPALRDRKE
ncbi:MAG: nitrilase-related carbon-nitrogen hydrolase [Rectinemataceae bacterium]